MTDNINRRNLEKRRARYQRYIEDKGCFATFPAIRPWQEGAIELIGEPNGVELRTKDFFWQFYFDALKMDPKNPLQPQKVSYTMEFSSKLVYLPMIGKDFLLAVYHLPTIGGWNAWVPSILTSISDPKNGFRIGEKKEEIDDPKKLIEAELARIEELEVSDRLTTKITPLSRNIKDKGPSASVNPFYLVQIDGAKFEKKKRHFYVTGEDGEPKQVKKRIFWVKVSFDELVDYSMNWAKPWDTNSNVMMNFLHCARYRNEIEI